MKNHSTLRMLHGSHVHRAFLTHALYVWFGRQEAEERNEIHLQAKLRKEIKMNT